MNALIRKEFRESVRWLPLGWLLMGGMLWATLPGLDQLDRATMLPNTLVFFSAIGCSFVALGLSIAQFMPDQRSAARAFLMHRGLTPKQLFQGKLAVGMAIYLLAVGIPLLVSGVYLEWVGPLRLPTSARQTIPAWVASVYAFSFYFGGCMVACGNARWIGTRVLPLVVSCLVTIASFTISAPAPLATFAIALSLGALGLVILFLASQETFARGASRDAPGMGPPSHWSRNIVLTASSITAVMIAMIFPTTFTAQDDLQRYVTTDVDATGNLWFVLKEQSHPIKRAKISSDADSMVVEKVTRDSQPLDGTLNVLFHLRSENSLWWGADRLGANVLQGQYLDLVYDSSGYILAYTALGDRRSRPAWMLKHIIGQDRISRPLEPRGKPFEAMPTLHLPNLLVSKDGLYRIDVESGTIRQVISQHVDGYSWDFDREKRLDFNRMFLLNGSNITEYRIPDSLGPNQTLDPIATFEADVNLKIGLGSFGYENQDNYSVIHQVAGSRFHIVQKRPGKELERFTCKPPEEMKPSYQGHSVFMNGLICMAVPVAYILVAGASVLVSVYGFGVSWSEFADGGGPEWIWAGAIVFLVQAILSGALAYAAARHRGLSRKARIGWAIGGALGGFGVALAIIAIYPRCIRETCWQCKRSRRVELPLCDHCGWEWETPTMEGIEVIGEKLMASEAVL